jgi:hypothetical protein
MGLPGKVKPPTEPFPFFRSQLALWWGFRVPGVSPYKPCSRGSGSLFLENRLKTPTVAFVSVGWYIPIDGSL